jgi:tetratricopeptide (TPR) repeat protein
VTRSPNFRLLLAFLALALLAAALVLALRPPDVPYLDLLRQGDEHADKVERTAAAAAYEEAARLRPSDPAPYLRLAQVYLDWGHTDDALLALSEAERLGVAESDSASLERLRIAVYAARADWLSVAACARRWLTLAPDNRDARHALARAYVELQAWDAAQAEYETLLRADAADPVARERLGVLLLEDVPLAIQHLLAAQTDLAQRLLATVGELGAVEDAAYASALLGRVLFEAEEWALAARQFERALSYNPDYADAHAYLAHTLDQMGRADEARFHLLRAASLDPDSATAHIFLGLHHDRLGDHTAARAEYETAYDLDPENPATCVEIGQTWVAEGRYVAAEIWLQQAVSLQPEDPALWEVLARFYLDHNITSMGRGVEAATKLVELSPGDARVHDLRGWAAFQVGDYITAQDHLLRATSLDPTLAEAHYHLGLLWDALGNHPEARKAFARAVDHDTTGKLIPLVERAMGEAP